MRRFIAGARRLGVHQVFLEVRTSNSAAITLYRSEFFTPIARRIAYYPGRTSDAPREDALVMRLALSPDAITEDGHGNAR